MKGISNRDVQEIEKNILKYVRDTCINNGLRYYLAYGTLIGAIRHHGFIPWDDDIDIVMPRKDYLRLLNIINADNSYYKVVSVDTNSKFNAPLPKVIDTRTKIVQHYGFIEETELGLYIDVFLIDGAGDDYSFALGYYDEAYSIYRKWKAADTQFLQPNISKLHSLWRWSKNIRYKIKGYHYWLNELEKHNKKFSFDDSKYVSVLEAGTPGAKRNVWPKSYFGDGVDVIFEGEKYKAPVEYDKLLRLEYGDYMTPPPKEFQVSHHYADVYWK